MTSSLFKFYSFATIICSLPRVWSISTKHFNIVSNATCQPQYAWMDNTEHQDPCEAVAYVIAACAGDSWTQPALPAGYKYDSPNGTTATPCYCSWSCYNLLMACTLCQSPANADDLTTWSSFFQNCQSGYNVFFPQGYVLANNSSSIPYWATTNPTTWPSELFDSNQAETLANLSYPDYFPSISGQNSTSASDRAGSAPNLGAIVGGSVGGAAGLLLVLTGGYFLYKRRQYRRLHSTSDGAVPILQTPVRSTHTRWPSDPSSVFPSTLMSPAPQSLGMESLGSRTISPSAYSSFATTSPPLPTETESYFTTGGVAHRTRPIPMV